MIIDGSGAPRAAIIHRQRLRQISPRGTMAWPISRPKLTRWRSKTAVEPEVIEQLRVWAVDLAEEADQAERPEVERERLTEKVEDAVLNW